MNALLIDGDPINYLSGQQVMAESVAIGGANQGCCGTLLGTVKWIPSSIPEHAQHCMAALAGGNILHRRGSNLLPLECLTWALG